MHFYGRIIDNVGSFMARLLYPEERYPGARGLGAS